MRRKTKLAHKSKPQPTEIVIVVEPTLADIDPYAHEQFEQEMRDAQFDKENSWVARLIHLGIRKRIPG